MRHWKKRLLAASALAVALATLPFLLVSCGGKSEKSAAMNVAFTDDSANLNPFHPNFFTVGRFLSGTLMRSDSKGGWYPQVASTVEWSKEGPHLVVAANAGHTFADGTPVRPADIVASINAHADAKVGSPASSVLAANGFIGAEAAGEGKVHVRFKARWAPALNFIRQLSIWPESLVNKVKSDPQGVKVAVDELVGAGTHKLAEYVPNSHAVLNPVQSGPTIRVKLIADDNGVLTQFEEGEIDLAYAEPRRQIRYAKIPGARVMKYPYPEVVTMAFNMETAKDRNLREALSRATDAEIYRMLVAQDGSERADGRIFCGTENGWNAPDAGKVLPSFDVAEANRLLDKEYPVRGGSRVGADGKPLNITIITYDSTEYPILAERLAADWKKSLSVEVSCRVLKSSQFNDVIYRRSADVKPSDWQVVIAEWPYQLADFEPSRADSLLDTSIPTDGRAGRNIIGWRDDKVSGLVRSADAETDPARRMSKYHEIHRRMLSERVVLPLYIVHDSWVASGRVEGFADDEPYMKHFIYRWADKLKIKK